MLYVLTNTAGLTELHEDAELVLVAGAVELTPDQMLALQFGTMSFVNGVVA
jgi:hypothetical protein